VHPCGKAEPGDEITYTGDVNNPTANDAIGVTFQRHDRCEHHAGSPSLKVSPVAIADTYAAEQNVNLNVAAQAPPNRVRDFTSDPANASSNGTLSIRRRVGNNTGGSITRLRLRIVELTTFAPGPRQADLRTRTSADAPGVTVNDPSACSASGFGFTPCLATVQGTTLEQPAVQLLAVGGGLNSTMTVNLATPLANGASVNVNFPRGVQQPGTFGFYIIVEALAVRADGQEERRKCAALPSKCCNR
jgi:hypothetical protein